MPASATPAGPAAAAQPEPKAEPGSQKTEDGGQRSEVGGRKPEGGGDESQSPTEVSESDLAAHLNLSPEARKQVAAHTAKAKAKPEGPAAAEAERAERSEDGGQRSEGESATAEATADSSSPADSGTGEEGEEHAGDDDEEAEGIPQFIKGIEDPKLRKKLEKRFGRLTGKNSRLEERLERQEEELGQYRQLQQQPNGQQQQPAPQALGEVRSEEQLDGLVAYHEAVIDLAERNPDGVQIGEGEKGRFVPAEEIASLRRTSEKFMRGAERRRRELREQAAARQSYDAQATRDFPEVMKKDTPEFQTAVKLAGRYPWVCQLPEANYALGLMVEGFKALNGRGKTRNAERGMRNGDEELDERLTPEYQRDHIPPTAPVAPKPPNRAPASAGNGRFDARKAAAVTEKFTRPGGATATNLADAFRALDEDEEEAPSRRRVAV